MNKTIVYSKADDYIDLREEFDLLKLKNRTRKNEPILKPTRSNNYNCISRNELGSSYSRIHGKNAFQNLAKLNSQSEFEITPPNSLKNYRQTFISDFKNLEKDHCSQQPLGDTITETKEKESESTIWKDPRLKEKYSVLQLPWARRSHTVPIDLSKIPLKSKQNYINEVVYAKNYRYDEGSDADSSSIVECKICSSLNFFQQAIKTSFFILYNCATYVSAFLIVCLFLWCATNQNLLSNLFQRKPPESQLTKLFKYLGGMVMYSFNTALSGTQQMFGLSTKVVYNQPTDTWPPRIY